MRKTIVFLALLCLTLTPRIDAQTFSLPSLDGLTVFYRAGRLESSALKASYSSPCPSGLSGLPLCGWGFETIWHLKERDDVSRWGAEVGLGYDFVNFRGAFRSTRAYQLFGSIQTIPSFSFYWSHTLGKATGDAKQGDLKNGTPKKSARARAGYYLGLGTGLLFLKNVRAYDASGRIYGLDGTAWTLAPSAGLTYDLMEKNENGNGHPGVSVFLELAYEARDFPSLAYTLPSGMQTLPADLPRRLAATGPILNLGAEVSLFHKEKETCQPCCPNSRAGCPAR